MTDLTMEEFQATPLWTDARKASALLVDDGWFCPDSYTKYFSPIIDESAVYLFQLYNAEDLSFTKALFAYVGMSTRLKFRLSGHEILRQIQDQYSWPHYWPCRWFKPTKIDDLRAVERSYIERFNPPWNIIGKRRGIEYV